MGSTKRAVFKKSRCLLTMASLFARLEVGKDSEVRKVKQWNLEQKKAFIQMYSGVDLMQELEDQEEQLHRLRLEYVQRIRANEEFHLLQQSKHRLNVNDAVDSEVDTEEELDDDDILYAATSSEQEQSESLKMGNHHKSKRHHNKIKSHTNTEDMVDGLDTDNEEDLSLTQLSTAIKKISPLMSPAKNPRNPKDIALGHTPTASGTMVVHHGIAPPASNTGLV